MKSGGQRGSIEKHRVDESHEVSTFLQPDSTKKLYGKQNRETIMVPIWPWLWVILFGKFIFDGKFAATVGWFVFGYLKHYMQSINL